MNESNKSWKSLPLDEEYYDPDVDETLFLKKETSIRDDTELKRHLISVQTKAFSVSSMRRYATTFLHDN